MPSSQRSEMGKIARQWVIDNFSVEVVGKKLEEIIDNMPAVDYDYESKHRDYNLSYEAEPCAEKEDLIINIYKNILDEDVDKNSDAVKHWVEKIY